MAERRMFTQKIVESDDFLDMPCSAQSLYFHLNMRADDDGFVNNARSITRAVGSSADDLKLLIAKRFVLAFDNCIVIKHWRMHNTLRKDRYKATQYQGEYALLTVKENGAYTEALSCGNQMVTTWQPNGNQTATQYSVEENRIDKDRLVEGRGIEIATPAPNIQEIIDLYNFICISLPAVKTLSATRRQNIETALQSFTLEDFETCFTNAEASSFLKGQKKGGFKASFDWLIKGENMPKVIDGNYADTPVNPNGSYEVNDFFRAALDKSYIDRSEANQNNPPQTAADNPELYERAQALKSQIG